MIYVGAKAGNAVGTRLANRRSCINQRDVLLLADVGQRFFRLRDDSQRTNVFIKRSLVGGQCFVEPSPSIKTSCDPEVQQRVAIINFCGRVV